MGRSRRRAATRASALFFLLLEHPGDRATLAGLGILHHAVGLPALVVLGQVLGDWHALLGDEEQAVAVLVLLHLLARADPAPLLGLCLGVRIEVAGAERTTDFFDMPGQALHDGFGHGHVGVERRAGFFSELAGVRPHLVDVGL